MIYPVIKIIFDRKNEATKNKPALIQIEVLYKRKRVYFSTGVKVYAGQWKDKAMVVGRADALELNERIRVLSRDISNHVNEMIDGGDMFSLEELKRRMNPRKEKEEEDKRSFIKFMESRIPERGVKRVTSNQHKTDLKKLVDFGKIQTFDDLTKNNVKLFNEYLKKQGYKQSTIRRVHKNIRIYVGEAIDFGYLTTDPYFKYSIPRGNELTRKYLTESEVQAIKNVQLNNESLERTRDCFVFCCYTGLAYSDLAKFKWDNAWEEFGEYVIHDSRQKTDTNYNITILSPAMDILKKYHYKLPIISNYEFNRILKIVALHAGINKRITSHMARHTFATWALSKGVRLPVVSKMLGHKKISTTEIYAKVLQKDVSEGFKLLESKLK